MTMMMAARVPPVYGFGQAASRTGNAISPGTATASFRLNTNGEAESAATAGTFTSEYTWKAAWATPGDYEVKVDVLTGSFSTGSTGVFLALSSTRTWTRSRSSVGSDVVTANVTLRHIATGIVLAVSGLTLTATVDL